MSSLNTDKLVETLGDYCREFYQDLYSTLKTTMSFRAMGITSLDDVSDELVLTEAVIADDIVVPFKQDFEPKADAIDFVPRVLKVRDCKVDLQLQVKVLHKTWLGMVKVKGSSAYNMPFEAFLMQEIIKKAQKDIETKALFNGNYNAAGTTTAATFDGWLTQLDDSAVAEETMNLAVLATITSSNAVAQIETLVAAVASDYLNDESMVCVVSPTVKRYYELDYRARYGALPYNNEFRKTIIDGTAISLVAPMGMTATNKAIITPANNFVFGADSVADESSLIVEKEKRNINVLMDFSLGVNFFSYNNLWYGRPAVA